MGLFGLPQMFVATVIMLCADPVSGGTTPREEAADLAQDVAETVGHVDAVDPVPASVIASTPLPQGFGPGSGFGYRTSPRTGLRTFHAGVDFMALRGTPVFAVRDGVVETVARERGRGQHFSGYGNAVVVYHPDLDQWSFYAHLSEVNVEPGQRVEAGTNVGRVGNTTNGRFRGMPSHLHFEVRSRPVDGGSPFPGAYRRHNLDPEQWLAEIGVRFEHEGHDHDHESAPVLVRANEHPVVMAQSDTGIGQM
jgi:murein DD-endopeptidase MepM/ murein hydrolase activator NlpD